MFYYFYRFLLSSCVCQLLIQFMMMMQISITISTDGFKLMLESGWLFSEDTVTMAASHAPTDT